jgi:FxLD family lantipeptide
MAFLLMKGIVMSVTASTNRSPLDLDIRIVTGPDAAAAQLLGTTDDGCDTRKDGDC